MQDGRGFAGMLRIIELLKLGDDFVKDGRGDLRVGENIVNRLRILTRYWRPGQTHIKDNVPDNRRFYR